MSEKTIPDVVCTICGTGCDDLQVKIKDGKITEAKNACAVSMGKFLGQHAERYSSPMIRRGGELHPASLDEAISEVCNHTFKRKVPNSLGMESHEYRGNLCGCGTC